MFNRDESFGDHNDDDSQDLSFEELNAAAAA